MMPSLHGVLVVCCCMLGLYQVAAQDIAASGAYRLSNNAQYLALAPRKVHPQQTYQLYITLFSMPFHQLDLRAVLSQDGQEYASAAETVFMKGTKRMQLLVPVTVSQGKHKLTIEGLVGGSGDGRGQAVFSNETILSFDSKYVSIFIQPDRPLYYSSYEPWDMVRFRIVATTPSLQPVSGPVTIYVKDPHGDVVRRYFQKQLNFGIYEDSFIIPYPCRIGSNWSIEVDGFGHRYNQHFKVDHWFYERFEVNFTAPLYIFDTEWGVGGTVIAQYLSGMFVTGNLTIELKVRNPDGTFMEGSINRTTSWMKNQVPWDFTLSEIKEKFGELGGKDLFFKAWFYDWYWMEVGNSTAVTKVIEDGIRIKTLGRKFRTFKPRIPFSVYFAIQRTDGTPYSGFLNRQVEVTEIHHGSSASSERKVIIPDDAIVQVEVVPNENDKRITIRVRHSVTGSSEEVECYRYWSDFNRYISVSTSTVVPKVNEYMIFTIRANFFVEEVHYLIIAGGNIVVGNSLSLTTKQKTFSLALSRKMSPRARIVVYAVKDGEVLADSLNFFVEDTRLHKASLSINPGKDFRGNHIELIGKGTPGAYLSTSGLDYEVYKRGANTFITREKVIDELLTYDYPNEGPYQHKWWHDSPLWESSVFFTAPTYGVDHLTTFNLSGLAALSDMNLTATPESHNCNKTLGLGRCKSGMCFELKYLCDGKIDCTEDGFDEMNCPVPAPRAPRPNALEDLHLISRYFTNLDWVWHTTYIKHYGGVEIATEVPENDQPIVVGAFVLDRVEGLAIAPHAMHDCTRSFYMNVEAPTTIRRGEQVGLRLTIFNYWDQDLEVLAMLHDDPSGAFEFVHVEEYGWANSYSPRTSRGDVQTMVEMQAGETKWIHFPIVATMETGEFTVTVSAYSFLRIDVEEITITVVYDGAENDDHTPYLIDLVNKGSIIIPDFDIPIPERFFVPNQRELLYVPGSNTVSMFLYGNVVCPGFFEKYLSVDNTAGVPADSTDAYAYDVAVNLQVLNYLQIVNALDRETQDNALTFMKDVLPRLYTNMQYDGSFKMFSFSRKPCLWATAFAMKTLAGILSSEWNEDLYVPVETINKVALWVVSQQDNQTGVFRETAAHVYNRNFESFSVDEDGNTHHWHLPTTAYVTIALAETSRLTGTAKTAVDTAKQMAGTYMASYVQRITDPFQMAIVAYALNVIKHKSKNDAYARLKSMRRETEFIYWANQEITPNPTRIVNTVHFMLPRDDFINQQNANMATSYALMLYIAHNEFDASIPIMKWLNTQHNDMLSWSSTQDTLLVIKALTTYAFRETYRDIYQMRVELVATKNPEWRHVVHLNSTNFASLYSFDLDRAWGQIKARATGTGYAFLHMTSLHKVEHFNQVSGPDFLSLSFEPENVVCRGRNCSLYDMTICTRWLRPDIAPIAGQSFFVMEVPTGYNIPRSRIDHIYNQHVPGLVWADFTDAKLSVEFEYVTQEKTCFQVLADRWWPVANMSIPHLINVYEYAETGIHIHSMYETYALFHNHICHVCGSFQCPYCPFYNSAPSLLMHLPVATMIASMLVSIWAYERQW